MYSNEFQAIVDLRRSNRIFNNEIAVPNEVIQRSLERAILSPNSSNMQLWQFHWITNPELKKEFTALCLNQQAAQTAQHLVVFVTRHDLWKKHAKWNSDQIRATIKGEPSAGEKSGINYYTKLIPIVYRRDLFGFNALFRRTLTTIMGIKKPFMRLGGHADQRIMVHKSCALAAQTFMLSIAAEGFDSCPMEGFDQKRVKRKLGLGRNTEINMIIAVGKGTEAGIWGPRKRVPTSETIILH